MGKHPGVDSNFLNGILLFYLYTARARHSPLFISASLTVVFFIGYSGDVLRLYLRITAQ